MFKLLLLITILTVVIQAAIHVRNGRLVDDRGA